MSKSTKILIGVLIVLGLAYAVQLLTSKTSTARKVKPFSTIDTSRVNEISILSGKRIVLSRGANGWMLTSPVNYPADRGEVGMLLSQIASDPSGSVVADNLADSGAYGLGAGAPEIILIENGGTSVAVRVGRESAGTEGCYVQISGRTDVVELPVDLRSVISRGVSDWRDRRIFSFGVSGIQAADFTIGDSLFHFSRNDTSWSLNGTPLPKSKGEEILGRLVGTYALDFVDSTVSAPHDAIDYGVTLSDGERTVGKVFNKAELGYISSSAANQTFVISSSLRENLKRDLRNAAKSYLTKDRL